MGSGANNFLDELLESSARWENKHDWVVHAEVFALRQAGIRARGGEIAVNYFPCARCAQELCLAGIQRIYAPKPDFTHHRWGDSWKASVLMLKMFGVGVEYVSTKDDGSHFVDAVTNMDGGRNGPHEGTIDRIQYGHTRRVGSS